MIISQKNLNGLVLLFRNDKQTYRTVRRQGSPQPSLVLFHGVVSVAHPRINRKLQLFLLGSNAGPEFLKEALRQYGSEKIVVGVDVKNGFVSTAGWLETSQMPYIEFIQYLESIGVGYIVATDISKDGTLTGPNFEMYDEIAKNSQIQFVFSGGIKDFDNIQKVAQKDYYACIVGKAYYEKKIDLKETIKCLQNV